MLFIRTALYLLVFGLSFVNADTTKKKNKNNIYLIRNAETASLNLPGLTPVGQERADSCLPNVSDG